MHAVTLSDVQYIGMMYHEKKEVNHWKSMYTVVRDLDVLLEVSIYYLILIINNVYLHVVYKE